MASTKPSPTWSPPDRRSETTKPATGYQCLDPARGRCLAKRVERVDSPWSRARGLLGRSGLEPGQALWLAPCRQVHTFFMRFAIDVIFLDQTGKVLRLCRRMAPWRISPWVAGAGSALELAEGGADGLALGDRLEFVPKEDGW